MKLLLASVAIVLATASLSLAGSAPVSGGLTATGVMTTEHATVSLTTSNGFVMEWAKVPPGASFGWHLHRRPVVVAVTAGTLTLYDGSDPSCSPRPYSAGQGFVEPANHVHVARNEGTKAVSLYAIYLGVARTWKTNPTPLDAAAKNPGNCAADIR